MRNHFANVLILLMLFVPLMVCCGPASAPPTTDPAIETLSAEHQRIAAEVRQLQSQVRALLIKIVEDIERDHLDVEHETQKVRSTVEEIKRLRLKLRSLPTYLGATDGKPRDAMGLRGSLSAPRDLGL